MHALQKIQHSFNEKIQELLESGRQRDREIEVDMLWKKFSSVCMYYKII